MISAEPKTSPTKTLRLLVNAQQAPTLYSGQYVEGSPLSRMSGPLAHEPGISRLRRLHPAFSDSLSRAAPSVNCRGRPHVVKGIASVSASTDESGTIMRSHPADAREKIPHHQAATHACVAAFAKREVTGFAELRTEAFATSRAAFTDLCALVVSQLYTGSCRGSLREFETCPDWVPAWTPLRISTVCQPVQGS